MSGDERGRAGSVGRFRNVSSLNEYLLYSSCQSRVFVLNLDPRLKILKGVRIEIM